MGEIILWYIGSTSIRNASPLSPKSPRTEADNKIEWTITTIWQYFLSTMPICSEVFVQRSIVNANKKVIYRIYEKYINHIDHNINTL